MLCYENGAASAFFFVLHINLEVKGMEEKCCGGCGWFDPSNHICGNAQTGIFITGESNTCPHWADFYDILKDLEEAENAEN